MEQIAAAETKSSTKSRFETASSEFSLTDANPSSSATDWRLVLQLTPASAPAPSGSSDASSRQWPNRLRSRLSIQK